MICSVTIVARPRKTTERTRTEGRKDRKGIGTDRRLKSDYDKHRARHGTPHLSQRITQRMETGFSGSFLCDLRDLL
jgi:hypothetical protein